MCLFNLLGISHIIQIANRQHGRLPGKLLAKKTELIVVQFMRTSREEVSQYVQENHFHRHSARHHRRRRAGVYHGKSDHWQRSKIIVSSFAVLTIGQIQRHKCRSEFFLDTMERNSFGTQSTRPTQGKISMTLPKPVKGFAKGNMAFVSPFQAMA
jgi:hypothetical protein